MNRWRIEIWTKGNLGYKASHASSREVAVRQDGSGWTLLEVAGLQV